MTAPGAPAGVRSPAAGGATLDPPPPAGRRARSSGPRLPDVRTVRRLVAGAGLPPGVTVATHPRSGRNRLFEVAAGDRRWIAKAGALGAEPWFYRTVGPGLAWVPASVPVAHRSVTLLDRVDGPSLVEVARADPSAAFDRLAALAPLLAELHAWAPAPGAAPPAAAPPLPTLAPVHVSAWLDATEASAHVLRAVHARPLLTHAVAAAARVAGPRGLIHGDLKADNVLCPAGGPVVVDWELCGLGSLAWDLGSLVASVLAVWLDGVDFDDPDPGSWLERTEIPYRQGCAAVAAVLAAYRGRARHPVPATAEIAGAAAAWLVTRSLAQSHFSRHLHPGQLFRLVVAEGLVRNPGALFRDGAQ